VARFTAHVVSMSPSELRTSFLACWNVKPPSIRAPAEGKPLPSELRKEEAQLRHEIELEDDNTAVPRTHMDDEYAHAGERDPQAWRLCRPLGLSLVSHSSSCAAPICTLTRAAALHTSEQGACAVQGCQ